jgi:DNA-binding transcriptional LysR family regulator
VLGDTTRIEIDAAMSGLGIAYVPEPFAREALQAGRLLELLQDWSPPFPGLCLYYASHRNLPAALRAFTAVIRETNRP